jgi:hypothetical protein
MTESIRTHRAVSRRTVVAGLAWSVPAIAATADPFTMSAMSS